MEAILNPHCLIRANLIFWASLVAQMAGGLGKVWEEKKKIFSSYEM